MKLWHIWLPPIEKPENIRIVSAKPRVSEARRRANQRYYAKNRARITEAERARYRARKASE